MNDAALARIAAEMSRRDFVRLLGASMALAGATGCVRQPAEPVYPYVHPPDEGAGGDLHYATAMSLDGFATGLLVRSVNGRPVKIEGNPRHPASRGASSAQQQGSLLQLYDPERARRVMARNQGASWDAVIGAYAIAKLQATAGRRGAGICLLMDPTSSPLTIMLIDRFREAMPDAMVHFHHTIENGAPIDATNAAFGRPLVALPELARAAVIVSLGSDPLASGPWHLRLARDFGDRRRAGEPATLHVAETAPSCTGSLSRHRLAIAPVELTNVALALVQLVAERVGATGVRVISRPLTSAADAWVRQTADDLLAHRSESAVIAGAQMPVPVQLAALALNDLLGNTGSTISYAASPVHDDGSAAHRPESLAAALGTGAIDTIIVTATNPVYTAPADLPLREHFPGIPRSLYLGEYRDETAGGAKMFAPRAHYLESWDLARACDGTISPVQPLIAPLWDSHTVDELLAALLGDVRPARALLDSLQPAAMATEVLRTGVVHGTASPTVTPRLRWEALAALAPPHEAEPGIPILFPAGTTHDGRFAGNAWLQELPDPITKLTWDNALLLGPATAARFSVASGDLVQLGRGDRRITAPVLIVPGHAEAAGSLSLGYGRRGEGILNQMIGVDTAPLRSMASPFLANNVALTPTGRTHPLALTQAHWSIEGRAADVTAGSGHDRSDSVLYHGTPPGHDGFGRDQWAMTIDLDLCTGCSACVVACQAENNIPVVGKSGVMHSREMHWIRIDRYLDGAPDAGGVVSQPMLCQHCENAPCEYVCPVNATVHSDDGLNEMIYNRCVGTRFCSNNCPYKVRRFNWLNYHDEITPVDELLNNPDVTMRSRGVMEKCTFCVQRIRTAQEHAALSGAERTGPVVTACQQSCPTGAIIFGSLTNPNDRVTASFAHRRAFAALASLNTRPRVRYLAREPLAPPDGAT